MYALSQAKELNKEDYAKALPLVKMGGWRQAQFQSVDEVKQALLKQPVWSPSLFLLDNSC